MTDEFDSAVRARRRRATTFAVSGLAIVAAIAIAAITIFQGGPTPQPPMQSKLLIALSPIILPAPVEAVGPSLGPFASATITVPTWGSGINDCTTGRITLDQGIHYVQDSGKKSLLVMSHLESDVDRDGKVEHVVRLRCGESDTSGEQVVAYRPSGNGFVPLGRVVGTQDGVKLISDVRAKPDGSVEAWVSNSFTDSGPQTVPHQWRTYSWRGGKFVQTGGPTAFEANPPAAKLGVMARNLVFAESADGRLAATLEVAAVNRGDSAVSNVVLRIFLPDQVSPAGPGWEGCTKAPNTGSSGAIRLDCAIGALSAGATRWMSFDVVTVLRPTLNSFNHMVTIDQAPPFTYDASIEHEADITIVLP